MLLLPVVISVMEGGQTRVVCDIGVSFVVQQQFQAVSVASSRCVVKRGQAVGISGVDISAVV